MTSPGNRRPNIAPSARRVIRMACVGAAVLALCTSAFPTREAMAVDDAYRPPSDTMSGASGDDSYQGGDYNGGSGRADDSYHPGGANQAPRSNDGYNPRAESNYGSGGNYNSQSGNYRPYGSDNSGGSGYGEPYPSSDRGAGGREERYEPGPPPGGYAGPPPQNSYSQDEIVRAGHSFFGKVTGGLAEAVEWAFHKVGRPNGYILGQDAGGAIVAGLRYGEGTLYTKDAGNHKVYWQGPSVGYDFGGEGSKVMTLVYNLRDPSEIYERFGGVQGAAYLVGGVSVQLEKAGHVTLAPIRAGVGLRLGANVGYLKYTRSPTWNPF